MSEGLLSRQPACGGDNSVLRLDQNPLLLVHDVRTVDDFLSLLD